MIVTMSVLNRPKITALCLGQLAKTKREGTKIQAWDAGSTEFGENDLLDWGADEVFFGYGRQNDQNNRALQMRHFLESESDDLFYAVDNDGWHDPAWEDELESLYAQYGGVVTLFNSYNHSVIKRTPKFALKGGKSLIRETGDAVIRQTCGGISLLVHRTLIEDHFKGTLRSGYDWQVCEWAEHIVTAKRSHIAHLDIDGIHSGINDGIDTGMDPTSAVQRFIAEVKL